MTLDRLLSTLEAEDHGRLGGRDRLATIVFPHSLAVVPQELAVAVLRGLREVRHG